MRIQILISWDYLSKISRRNFSCSSSFSRSFITDRYSQRALWTIACDAAPLSGLLKLVMETSASRIAQGSPRTYIVTKFSFTAFRILFFRSPSRPSKTPFSPRFVRSRSSSLPAVTVTLNKLASLP